MAEGTKERILRTALELFAQNGYLGTSMNDIAKQLGFTKAALYKHYTSKQEILDRATGERVSTGMEPSNVLYYELADRCNLAVRPSGTEPKIKIYVMAQGDSMEKAEANLRCIEDGIMEMLKREN